MKCNALCAISTIETNKELHFILELSDNGGEFARFGLFSLQGIMTYFCDPGAPYQKGQVERTNAILHKFTPKKTEFNKISNDNVIDANEKLNNLPRKCLNYLTPNEAWDKFQIQARCA